MASVDSQENSMLKDNLYDDPSQLSQRLRQRAGSHFPHRIPESTAHHAASAAPAFAIEGQPSPQRGPKDARGVALSPPCEATRRVRFDSRHVRPRLPQHHTAPDSTGFLTEREAARRMHQTFNGAMDAPGDTQADPDMFKEFTSGIMESNITLEAVPRPRLPVAEEGSPSPSEGYDVVISSQSQRSAAVTSPTINDDPEMQIQNQYGSVSPMKFATPALAARKWDSQGRTLSSAVRSNTTPGTVLSASAFFGFGDTANVNAMSLTQAFNATQAKTSPAVGDLGEDVVFQRPSPNFVHAPRRSSPETGMSSPIKPTNKREPVTDPVLRSSSEPRADYETMKQSQVRRDRELPSIGIGEVRQDSWEEPGEVEKHFFKQKAKQRLNQAAAKSLSAVSAPTPLARRTRRRGLISMSATASAMSPVKKTTAGRAANDGGYDGAEDNELAQTSPRPGDDNEDSLDELSQDIFPSPGRSLTQTPTGKETGVEKRVQVPHTSSHPPRNLSGHSSRNLSQPDISLSQLQRGTRNPDSVSQPLPKSLSKLRSSKDSDLVVMDSQPEPAETQGPPRPDPLRFLSSPSANQYSINQTTMLSKSGLPTSPASSMPPMPPRSSSHDDVEERVPSSPPVIAQVDDIVYDEHGYEEGSDDEREALSSEEEVNNDQEQDELPVVHEDDSRDVDPGLDGQTDEAVKHDDDVHDDDEVPETLEQENYVEYHNEDGGSSRSSHSRDNIDESANTSMAPPRLTRQSTVPETDVLEDTQPSFFPEVKDASPLALSRNEVTVGSIQQQQTNSIERFDAAKEHQSASQADKQVSGGAEPDMTVDSLEPTNRTSLFDIANQPDTQRSIHLDEIELPQLSFDADSDDPLNAMTARSPLRPHKKRKTTYSTKKAFRSPIKETDPVSDELSSPPRVGVSNPRGWSPPTTQDREAQGALAAGRARDNAVIAQPATWKPKTHLKPTLPQTPRKGALKAVNKILMSKSPGETPPKAIPQRRTTENAIPTRSVEMADANDVEMRDADRLNEVDELAPSPPVVEHDCQVAIASDNGEPPSGELRVPNRVFAAWPGKSYYPATCIGRVDSHRLRVRYDDGNTHVLESIQVRALDLRPGDQVKLDVAGMKKQAYTVIGFKNKIRPDDFTIDYPLTDRHGYTTIILEEKQRESLPATKSEQANKHIVAAVASIYLTTQLWARLKDRLFQYTPVATPSGSASRTGTPRAADAGTPKPTMSRKNTLGPSLLRDSTARAVSVASSARSGSNIFLNMAFAITIKDDYTRKYGFSKLITSSGGLVVDEGFHELFDTNSYDAPMSSEGTTKEVSGLDRLLLKRDLGFVALIADSHSRSTKYLQALALNVPCVHYRWIHDSLSALRALPFAKYLLPAGISTFLNPKGVVRSRDIPTYDPTAEDVSFTRTVNERDLLFRDQSVLLITGEEDKEIELNQPYSFLTRAMGAADVGQCTNITTAKDIIADGEWDWVYVNSKPAALAEAAAALLGDVDGGKTITRKKVTNKRKRDEKAEPGVLVRSGFVGEKRVKVACGEFVIQSLILGALMEE